MSMSSSPTPAAPRSPWWNPFARMEELSFMRTPEGWVFQAPNPWMIGPRRHYLVNDAQKAVISGHLRRMWTMTLLAILVMVVVAIPVSEDFGGIRHPFVMLSVFVLLGAAGGFVVSALAAYRLRPVIAGLEPTTQRITRLGAIQTQARIFSRARIAFFGILSIALLVLELMSPFVFAHGWSALTVTGVVIFGATTIYWSILFIAKSRMERSAC
jgi:hypothetical protein